MRFYSGFCLRDESAFFAPWLKQNDFTVAGFSYGAIKALYDVLQSDRRIDTLQLFSPAYFCNKPDSFKRLQMKGYKRDSAAYRARFIESCFVPYPARDVSVYDEGEEALEELLGYPWPEKLLRELNERGVHIEVYLGGKDAVIDAEAARAFFMPYATLYYFKDANHFLQGA
ncbi:pimelyl-ACP methyl ester esterase BioV [Sulfurimonas sp. HSL1-6]|uniref:pimelyl-ACP methyl ester esterase BioV n=1 Tax=Thiomicrolovo immobilis TaxID=3131935 RepID=UPI0031F8734D